MNSDELRTEVLPTDVTEVLSSEVTEALRTEVLPNGTTQGITKQGTTTPDPISRTEGTASVQLTKRKKSPIWLFIVIGLAVAAVIIAIVIIIAAGNGGSRVQKKITAAEKYLSELDYENAIASYREAISIDPNAVEAYLGLADIYLAMGKIAEAVSVLQEGVNATESDILKEKLKLITERNLDNSEIVDVASDDIIDENIDATDEDMNETFAESSGIIVQDMFGVLPYKGVILNYDRYEDAHIADGYIINKGITYTELGNDRINIRIRLLSVLEVNEEYPKMCSYYGLIDAYTGQILDINEVVVNYNDKEEIIYISRSDGSTMDFTDICDYCEINVDIPSDYEGLLIYAVYADEDDLAMGTTEWRQIRTIYYGKKTEFFKVVPTDASDNPEVGFSRHSATGFDDFWSPWND